MKKLFLFSSITIFVVMSLAVFAQGQKEDKLVMVSGEEKTGHINEMGDGYVKFVHAGETLVYTIKKEEINKIQFASGRIEFITEIKKSAFSDSSGLQSHHNMIAVLPFSYIGRGGNRDEKLSVKVQSDCYNTLLTYAKQFSYQDPVTTNATLIKHNINSESIAGFTPVELTHILNVEYIVMGTIVVADKGSSTGSGSYFSGKSDGKKNSGYVLGSSSTTTKFATTVDMKIYTEQGQNIFSKSHESFWQTEDAYTVTLKYLIKRSPLYHK